MRVIALVNQKGGVGKTTSAINIGAGLARAGRRVLLVDLDPQANLTEGFGVQPEGLEQTVLDVLVSGAAMKDVMVNIGEGLDLVPANTDLCGADVHLIGSEDNGMRLKSALAKMRGYDYVLIDCPPGLGQLTVNALNAAKEVFVPIQTHFFALRGLTGLLSTIEAVQRHSNKTLRVTGLIATMHDARTNLNRMVIEQLESHLGAKLFRTPIRTNVNIGEAPATGQDIFAYRPSSIGAQDYKALCDEILGQEVA